MNPIVWQLNGIREVRLDLPGHGQVVVKISDDDALTFWSADNAPSAHCQRIMLGAPWCRRPAVEVCEIKSSGVVVVGGRSVGNASGRAVVLGDGNAVAGSPATTVKPRARRTQSELWVPVGTCIYIRSLRTAWTATSDVYKLLRN